MNDIVLSAENLGKAYPLPKGDLRVFQGIDFELRRGDLAAIMGMSGVGKTTLLNLLGTLDRPSEGTIRLDGEDLAVRSDLEISGLRNSKIGFVFQFYHLLPEFTALENISIPLLIRGMGRKEALPRARKLLDEVGLGDKANFRPGQMSGGEQQRVAVARALVNEPKVLLADEPTGNLDSKTGEEVFELLRQINRERRLTSLLVTHNEVLAGRTDRLLRMLDGRMVE